MIEDVLHAIGAPGWLIITASTLLGLYHFRHVLGLAAVLGSYLRMAGVAAAVFVIIASGVIPGIHLDLSVQVGVLLDIIGGVWRFVRDVAGVVV